MRITPFALFICLVATSQTNAQPISFFVDNFANSVSGPPTGDSVSDNTGSGNAVWAAFGPGSWTNTLGGRRILGNQYESGNFGGNNNSTSVVNSRFNIFNDTTTRSRGQLIWDGGSTTPTGPITGTPQNFLLNKDVIAGVSNVDFNLEVSVLNADLRTWTYTVRAYTSNSSNYFEAVVNTNTSGDGVTPVSFFINRSQFSIAAGTPSWNDIDAITFDVRYSSQPLGGDLALTLLQFVAVPELSTYMSIGLLLLTAGAMYGYRRGSRESGAANKTARTSTVDNAVAPETQAVLDPL